MYFEHHPLHRTVREGYQVLLRAHADLLLPDASAAHMRDFYLRLGESCLSWAAEQEGERLRAALLSLDSLRDRARFSTVSYHLWMEIPWGDDLYVAVVVRSLLGLEERRSSAIWNKREETLLPPAEARRLFSESLGHRPLNFKPHGFYPKGDELILFRNPVGETGFLEQRLPLILGKGRGVVGDEEE